MLKTLIGALFVALLLCIAPAMVWAAPGRWRQAWQAAREYWGVLGALALVGCGLALVMIAAEAIG